MASISDKITDIRNAARPNSARVSSGRSAGGTTLSCDNLAGWPTASKVHFVTYTIDSNSNPVSGTQLDCVGIRSGNDITSFTVIDGTDTGNSINDVVEMLPTAAWGQDLADALTVGHERTGAHKASLPLTSPILTTPVIADYTSATHTHATNGQGGKITSAGITSFDTSLTTISNPYKFLAYATGYATFPNASFTKVQLFNETYDTNSNFDTTLSRYTAPVSGFYIFNGAIQFNVFANTHMAASLFKNGAEIQRGNELDAGTATQNRSLLLGSSPIQVTAGDFFEMYGYQSQGGVATVQGGVEATYFSGYLLSRT